MTSTPPPPDERPDSSAGRAGERGLPPLPPLPTDHPPIEIPDDARALDRDLAALRREQAAARRQARLRRLLLTRRWDSYGISGPLVVAVLLVVSLFATALALLVPTGTPGRPRPAPLANPTVPPGSVGGLLPAAELPAVGPAGGTRSTARLRPGAVLLVTDRCDPVTCRTTVNALVTSAHDNGLLTWLVGPGPDGLVELAREDARGGGFAVPLRDPGRVLLGAYEVRPGQVTLLVVDPAGVVRHVVPGVTENSRVQALLADAREPE